MVKKIFLLALTLLLVVAAGCRSAEPEAADPVPPSDVLCLETLAVEISRSDLDTQTLIEAVAVLPDLLEACFAETEAEIGEIKVTVGASPADTVQALETGSVHLAFLPAEGLLSNRREAVPLFGDAQASDSGELESGARALICAAPTAYGEQLANRAVSGKPLSWGELETARWGLLEADESCRCFDLWLADEYAGRRASALPDVTVYNSYEDLFRAAAAEEIDALVFWDDVRTGVADAWTREEIRTDTTIVHGFGREADIWQELPVLEVTERLYSQIAAVAPDVPALTDARFVGALAQVLEQLAEDSPEQMRALGAQRFAAVEDDLLDATRRLLALE